MERTLRGELVGVVALMLVVVAVTVPFLAQPDFWFDEIFSVTTASSWSRMGEIFSRYENNMALYYVLLHGWMGLGTDETTVRLLSVLFAVATVPVLHLLAARLWNTRVAFTADAMLISCGMFLHYATEARSYSLLLLLATFASLMFVEGLRRPTWPRWIAYAVIVGLSSYVHYFGILTPLAHAVSVLWLRREEVPWDKFIGAGLLVMFLLIPQAVFHPPSLSQVDWIDRPGALAIYNVGTAFAGGRSRLLAYILVMVMVVVAMLWRRQTTSPSERWPVIFLLCWLVVPLIVAVSVSWLVKPVFMPKYLIGCLPAMLLLVAVGLARLRTWALVLCLGLAAAHTANLARTQRAVSPGPYRSAVAVLTAKAHPDDVLLCYPFYIALPVTWEFGRVATTAMAPRLQEFATGLYHPGAGARDPDPDLALVRQLATQHDRVWLVTTSEHSDFLNRTWRTSIESAIASARPLRSAVSFEGGENHNRLEVILFAGVATSSEHPAPLPVPGSPSAIP